jgi:S1-C subfamily serine protease
VNALDLVLIVVAIAYAFAGYRQGFLVGAGSTAGLLLGVFVGAKLAPTLLHGLSPSLTVSSVALALLLLAALLGRASGAFLGGRLRTGLTWRPVRLLDALSGSLLSGVGVLLIAWVLGVAVSGVQLHQLNREIRTSAVLGTVDHALPGGADGVLATFNSLVDSSRFPQYLEPFTAEHIVNVPRPPRSIRRLPGVAADSASVVKVLGAAPSCGHDLEGSGFVYARGRVMTNAHVVAGVDSPFVQLDGKQYRAVVVYYDSSVDVAVLRVPGLPAPALHFGGPGQPRDLGAVLGYPENGPYDVEPARLRSTQSLRSPNIYGDNIVSRETYSIFARVRQGNSGGPLVNRSGAVIGVIFAASVADPRTGYALTADQVSTAAQVGDSSTARVETGACSL